MSERVAHKLRLGICEFKLCYSFLTETDKSKISSRYIRMQKKKSAFSSRRLFDFTHAEVRRFHASVGNPWVLKSLNKLHAFSMYCHGFESYSRWVFACRLFPLLALQFRSDMPGLRSCTYLYLYHYSWVVYFGDIGFLSFQLLYTRMLFERV